jgi:hypothetical protein
MMGLSVYTANAAALPILNLRGRKKAALPNDCRLFRSGRGLNVNAPPPTIEADVAIAQRKNGVIATKPDIFPGQKFCPALTHDNVAGHDQLASKFLYPEPFADAVAPILNAALPFFVRHLSLFFGFFSGLLCSA